MLIEWDGCQVAHPARREDEHAIHCTAGVGREVGGQVECRAGLEEWEVGMGSGVEVAMRGAGGGLIFGY